ncbi:hypothetical protein CYMTET_42836 [Cymbomonas tetramitiformis]|uniref:Response regulatory domain-containing protein n=1 Tax=Cymbomonas tetramitiformis TaxID=36881 RepID=A0AAE0F191_9CHLO|nr:hypothetical protein CYMTET_42836 [Cymbomonas tetramitiformis]
MGYIEVVLPHSGVNKANPEVNLPKPKFDDRMHEIQLSATAGVRVAALDDSPIARKLLQRSLEKMKFADVLIRGATFEEVVEFPSLVSKENVVLVILDLHLNEAVPSEYAKIHNGVAVMTRLRHTGFTGMCIARTADHDDKETVDSLVQSGFDAVVGKKNDLHILHEWQKWHIK